MNRAPGSRTMSPADEFVIVAFVSVALPRFDGTRSAWIPCGKGTGARREEPAGARALRCD
ncbi:hypothetical protein GCM10027360_23590 [Amycolatopsis echigonensis]